MVKLKLLRHIMGKGCFGMFGKQFVVKHMRYTRTGHGLP